MSLPVALSTIAPSDLKESLREQLRELVLMNDMDYRPHTLPPQSLFLAHLAPYLTSTQAQLEAELHTVQAENEQLARSLEGQRDEVEKIVSGLEAVIADLEGANGVMEGVIQEGEVKREAMEVERELGSRARVSRL